jgi:antagonist of KipI
VGNAAGANALEITIAGPELRIERKTTIAVAGANLSATLDGTRLSLQTPVTCNPGSVLRFGQRQSGARAYVAVAGGVMVNPFHAAGPLAAGVRLGAGAFAPFGARSVPAGSPMPSGGARLRVLPGPQQDQLPPDCFDTLCTSRFTVSPQSNRMGFRLTGPALPSAAGEMVSDATFPGAIQVTPSGQPILLMADRQTTGGYPQVAVVISADLPLAGQLAPGDWIEFVPCSREDALRALVEQEAMLTDGR